MAHILIIQKTRGRIYVYRETLHHHAAVQSNKVEYDENRDPKNWVPFSTFDHDCDALEVLENGQWTSAIVHTDD